MFFHASILLFHTLDEISIEQLQESLNIVQCTFKFEDASFWISLLTEWISQLCTLFVQLIS